MKYLFIALLFCAPVFAADAYNVNEFKWTAMRQDGKESCAGTGKTTRLYKVYQILQKTFDEKAKSGDIPDGTKYEVVVTWKDQETKRTITAHKKYPVPVPRGGPKEKEALPRK